MCKTMKIILCEKEFETEAAVTAYDAIKEAGLMTRDVIAAELDGETVALTAPITEGCRLAPLTFADKAGQRVFNHTAAHILAQAVKRLFPDAKLTIGPSVEDGFYYDFDSDTTFTREALDKLEGEMKKIVKENLKIERFTLPREEAIKLMEEKGEPYKVLLINRIPEGEEISFYRQGEFVDLCAGPHLFCNGCCQGV